MTASEELAVYAVQRLHASISVISPSTTVKAYALRFLILGSLDCAAQATGLTLLPWWGQVMNNVLQDYKLDAPLPWPSSPSSNIPLARDLAAALRQHKKTGFSPLAETAKLERRFLRNPNTAHYFWPPQCDPRRQDDKQV